jgi:hypothetical protein
MNTQIPDNGVNGSATPEAAANAIEKAAPKRKPRVTTKRKSADTGKPDKKRKKDQLVALLSKPNGTRISVIVERLGWRAHTVRAALPGLRKQGIEIATSKSPKTGETVYAIVAREDGNSRQAGEEAAS